MANLAHLKNVRAGHKGVVTKKLSDLENAMKATPRDEDSLRQLRTVFQEKLDIIKATFTRRQIHNNATKRNFSKNVSITVFNRLHEDVTLQAGSLTLVN